MDGFSKCLVLSLLLQSMVALALCQRFSVKGHFNFDFFFSVKSLKLGLGSRDEPGLSFCPRLSRDVEAKFGK